MSEEDTFKKLKQTPFPEVRDLLRTFIYTMVRTNDIKVDEYSALMDAYLAKHHWTFKEFVSVNQGLGDLFSSKPTGSK